ncbi:MAG: DUF4912 domain-containing protein [Fibrobacteria bacterium]|nr:DUF4912 domain-containing protein [Fibrobacteria bacterium]
MATPAKKSSAKSKTKTADVSKKTGTKMTKASPGAEPSRRVVAGSARVEARKSSASEAKPVAKASKPVRPAKVAAPSVPARTVTRKRTPRPASAPSGRKSSLLEGELPQGYGLDRLVAIPKDPEWTHLYWEISDATRNSLSEASSDGFRLRGFDTTGLLFDGRNAPVALDIEVAPYARSWYARLPYQGRVYTFEYGFVSHQGDWRTIARSQPVGFEPGMLGFRPDSEEWVSIASEELFRASAGLADGEGIADLIQKLRSRSENSAAMGGAAWLTSWGSGMGRLELAPSSWAPSSFETQALFTGSSWAGSSVGSHVSWSGLSEARPNQGPGGGKSKDFWLWVETELTLYGATEPDAQVTLMGRPITLNPDGTFRVQFPFPHGTELHMDVRAVDRDGDQVREAKPAARRWTED